MSDEVGRGVETGLDHHTVRFAANWGPISWIAFGATVLGPFVHLLGLGESWELMYAAVIGSIYVLVLASLALVAEVQLTAHSVQFSRMLLGRTLRSTAVPYSEIVSVELGSGLSVRTRQGATLRLPWGASKDLEQLKAMIDKRMQEVVEPEATEAFIDLERLGGRARGYTE